ncbi:transcription elongation protein SprT [Flavobacteriaceae bacterium Ap0902]|nr:transcription elongation protein SprT [Flavobacteriaceae bacterium Ap0902]
MFDEKLQSYLLPEAHIYLNKWCKGYRIKLLIKNARESKLGDYRKLDHDTHQITLNTGMSPALTFFTLTHEIAHMHARDKFGNGIKPHGREWKFSFAQLILETLHLYPKEIQPLLLKFSRNPKASFYASKDLASYFISKEEKEQLLLKDIPEGAKFRIKEKIFKKGNIRKIRYLCTEIYSGRKFTIHMLAPIDELIED